MAHEAFRVEWQLGPHRSEAQEALTKDGLSLEQRQSRGRTMTKARELLLQFGRVQVSKNFHRIDACFRMVC